MMPIEEKRVALAKRRGWTVEEWNNQGRKCYRILNRDGRHCGYEGFRSEQAVWEDGCWKTFVKFRSECLRSSLAYAKVALRELWRAVRGC